LTVSSGSLNELPGEKKLRRKMNINGMEVVLKYLPLLIPIALLQLGLLIAALVDILKREKTKGPKWVWIIVVVIFNLLGPIAYFIFGRNE
jgi:hypothetical protein